MRESTCDVWLVCLTKSAISSVLGKDLCTELFVIHHSRWDTVITSRKATIETDEVPRLPGDCCHGHWQVSTRMSQGGKWVNSSNHCRLLVTGDSEGQIKFFNSELKMLNWYDGEPSHGHTVSISFAHQPKLQANLDLQRYDIVIVHSHAIFSEAKLPEINF